MDLVLEYVTAVQEIDAIQEAGLDSRKKVRQNNKLADRLRAIASEIERTCPELKPAFCQLLFHETATVRHWAAHHMLEVMHYDDDCRRNALKEITHIITHDNGIEGLGNKMWLKQWLEQHPADKHLL